MESLGYIVTNKFILVGVNTNLNISVGEGQEQLAISLNNARKVYRVSDKTIIIIVGLAHKITDLFSYILGIKDSNKTFDSIIEDLESIYNSNTSKLIANMQMVAEVIPKYMNSDKVLDTTKFLEHFENNDDLYSIAKESLELLKSGTKSGTQIYLFTQEENINYLGKYLSLATNFSGLKSPQLPKDNFYLGLASSAIEMKQIEKLQAEKIIELKENLTSDWELSEEKILKLKLDSMEILSSALKEINPFPEEANIVFYELSNETDEIFKEPEINLIDVNFKRK